MIYKLVSSFIPRQQAKDDNLIRVKLLIMTFIITASFSLVYIATSIYIDFITGKYAMLALFFLCTIFLGLVRYGFPLLVLTNLFVGTSLVTVIIIIHNSGGLESPALPWLIVIPITALFLKSRYPRTWLALPLLYIGVLSILHRHGYAIEKEYNTTWHLEFQTITLAGLLLIIFLITYTFHISMTNALKKLKAKNMLTEEQKKEIEMHHDILKEKNDQLLTAQEHLKDSHIKIQKINSKLEEMVDERTAKIQKINEELYSVNSELDFFIYRASHDLRGPIARLLGIARVGKMDIKDEIALNYFRIFEESSINLDKILTKLLMVNQVRNTKVTEYALFDFQHLMEEIKKTFKNDILEYNIQIQYTCTPSTEFHSNYDLIKIIFYNLIENSIIFRKKEQNQPCINISIEMDAANISILYSDDGIGISNEIAPYIYDMFFRGTELSKGNGLGLYIVKKVIENLNGTITTKSEPEKYTSFHITLPQAITEKEITQRPGIYS